MIFGKDLNCNVMYNIPRDRPNPLQYFLVPDIEVENGGDDEDLDDEEEVDENVVVMEEEEGEEEEEEAEEEVEGEEK